MFWCGFPKQKQSNEKVGFKDFGRGDASEVGAVDKICPDMVLF